MRRAIALGLAVSALFASGATAAPLTITPIVTGQAGDAGWYIGDVIVNWSITPAPYLVELGCAATPITVDTTGRKVECQASSGPDRAYSSVTIRLDKTPPVVVAAPDRATDAGDFYNHASPSTGVLEIQRPASRRAHHRRPTPAPTPPTSP
jgi:hypothetical protein